MGTRWANRRRDTRARVPHFCNNPRDRTRIQDGDDVEREREREMHVFYLTPFPVLLAEMRERNTARNFTSNGIYLVERKRERERENSPFFTIRLTRIPAVDIEVPRSSLDLYESKSISRRVHCKECDSPRITFCRWYLMRKLRRPVTLR